MFVFLICLVTFCSLLILWDIIFHNYISFNILLINIMNTRYPFFIEYSPEWDFLSFSVEEAEILMEKENHIILRAHARKVTGIFSDCRSLASLLQDPPKPRQARDKVISHRVIPLFATSKEHLPRFLFFIVVRSQVALNRFMTR